jgi:hypothetical protein
VFRRRSQMPAISEPKPREVCTIYEIDTSGQRNWAQAVYNFRWTPQTDPLASYTRPSTIRVCQSIILPSRKTTAFSRTCAFQSGRISDAFRKMRRFLMTTKGLTEDEAISLISIAVDFGVTQGGRRQLGYSCHHQEEPLRRRVGMIGAVRKQYPLHAPAESQQARFTAQ